MKHQIISDKKLLEKYLPLKMERYFYKKLNSEKKEYVKLKITELLKYFLLAEYTSGPIPFSTEIDELWHLWILQTKQYQDLMKTLPSKNFFHHCSMDYYDESEKVFDEEKEINRKVSFLASYVYNFGKIKKEVLNFWPTALYLYNLHEKSLDKTNQYLISLTKN